MLMACSRQQKDKDVEKMLTSQAKQSLAFAGVNITVAEGVVALRGACPTQTSRTKVEEQVRQTAGVNEIVVTPVTLTGNEPGFQE